MQASEQIDRGAVVKGLAALVREAGALALRSTRSPIKSWFKGAGDGSPVSEIDLAVDRLLKERLGALLPGCGWLSEETEDDPARLGCDRLWVVDPIDGTRGFLAGKPDWTVSVALVEHGRPVIGALFAPASDEMFLATAGGGATRNGTPIAVARAGVAQDRATLAGSRVAGPPRLLERLAATTPGLVLEPKVHSLALRFARVAQGAIHVAFASRESHDWDLAAADLLVHEAAGTLTTVTGESIRYNRPVPTHEALIAADPARHRAVSEIVATLARTPR
ncbi:3'(2'),5'-bisphosphate nucleotidase CysQ [Rhodoplanes sp.]|uniref:3'(2'),5'-bisphosphate nucleotidase CysQ n=1 Tax=Rhodoplanes sp. TaxID=1968906 RepID=UPI0025EA5FF8|nr:3'(2'),5'-bisphosphate nucleotidase CysQ [Rhodoplanes sp.]